jgi:hypothetical protein
MRGIRHDLVSVRGKTHTILRIVIIVRVKIPFPTIFTPRKPLGRLPYRTVDCYPLKQDGPHGGSRTRNNLKNCGEVEKGQINGPYGGIRTLNLNGPHGGSRTRNLQNGGDVEQGKICGPQGGTRTLNLDPVTAGLTGFLVGGPSPSGAWEEFASVASNRQSGHLLMSVCLLHLL